MNSLEFYLKKKQIFLFFFRMNVSKMCGPFRGHVYMFHVLRGDILKLQEV